MNRILSGKNKKKYVLLASSLIFLTFFLATIAFIEFGFFQNMDNRVNSYFLNFSSIAFTQFFSILSILSDPISILAISLVFALGFLVKSRKKEAFFISVGAVLGECLVFLSKEIIGRVRPENLYESNFSFPSGHAVMAMIFFCSLIYLSFRNMKSKRGKYSVLTCSCFLIALIDFGRIYLGAHWLSDIIGGFFLGGFVFLFVLFFYER